MSGRKVERAGLVARGWVGRGVGVIEKRGEGKGKGGEIRGVRGGEGVKR